LHFVVRCEIFWLKKTTIYFSVQQCQHKCDALLLIQITENMPVLQFI